MLVAILVAIRIAIAVATWDPGWTTLTWDDFTRTAIAQEWAAHPLVAPDLVWLPLSTWIDGTAFMLFGGLVRHNPLLLMAVVNTVALIATAGVVAWSAHRLAGSRTGTMITFSAVLFSPWGLFASLSGMAESLYYLVVVLIIACTIAWLQTERRGWLIGGVVCVAAAALSRYEGWVLMAAWAAVLAVVAVGPLGRGVVGRIRHARATLALLALPGAIPLAWMALNWRRTGNPLQFASEVAHYFAISYGAVHGVVGRLTYYPLPLVRSAPLVLIAISVIVIARRRDRLVVIVTSIVALQFAVLYASSVLSPVVGAAAIERFLFVMVLALMPLLGHLPWLARTLRLPRIAIAAIVAISVIVTAVRITDRPTEWRYGPDLLTVAAALGDLGTIQDPLTIVLGPGLATEVMPLSVRNGDRMRVVYSPNLPITGPGAGLMWLEKLPDRIARIEQEPIATIGRYRVYGTTPLPTTVCTGCDGWTRVDERGTTSTIGSGPLVSLEFTDDDPVPGDVASISHRLARSAQDQIAVVQVRSLYGHGFNPGRIELQVAIDGEVAVKRDIAERSQWLDVRIPVAAGEGDAILTVSVVALPGIEPGWAWGRASTVLIRSLVLAAA